MLLWSEVVCDGCSLTTAGAFTKWGKRCAADVKRVLAEDGWQLSRAGQVYCPTCCRRKGWLKP